MNRERRFKNIFSCACEAGECFFVIPVELSIIFTLRSWPAKGMGKRNFAPSYLEEVCLPSSGKPLISVQATLRFYSRASDLPKARDEMCFRASAKVRRKGNTLRYSNKSIEFFLCGLSYPGPSQRSCTATRAGGGRLLKLLLSLRNPRCIGSSEIRTRDSFCYNAFQKHRFQPLSHRPFFLNVCFPPQDERQASTFGSQITQHTARLFPWASHITRTKER